MTGKGRFAADFKFPGMLHVAMVASPFTCAKINSIDSSLALELPGVHYVLTGEELAANINPLLSGLDLPDVKRLPLANGRARYAGSGLQPLLQIPAILPRTQLSLWQSTTRCSIL